MNKKDIKKALENTLLNNEKMDAELYEYEFEDLLDFLKESLRQSNDNAIFAVVVHKNDETRKHDTAMVLIEKSGKVHINEAAKKKLQDIWKDSYSANIRSMLPDFVEQLTVGAIPMECVKAVLQA
jgi:fructose 1,6-bisphosphatase